MNVSIITGDIIVPTPYAVNKIEGLNFYRFSDEISKNKIIEEFKNPLKKKFAKNKATLNKYELGISIVKQHVSPSSANVSIITDLN